VKRIGRGGAEIAMTGTLLYLVSIDIVPYIKID
jgi:hypothetical protein